MDAEELVDDAVGIQVPASSANLGPGFDAFAVALDVQLTVWTVPREERRIIAEGQGAEELPSDDGNLIWRAFAEYCRWASVDVPDVSLRCSNDIPLERGMGSSSAAAVAGIALARAVTRGGGRDADLIDLAAAFEGHADNAAAAVLGGLCVVLDGRASRLEPTDALRPLVCIPTGRQSTEEARGLLPEHIPLADAAANGARAAVTLAGLAGAMAFDPLAMTDVLHEPARLGAMTASGALVRALRDDGIGACLSGAGPTVLAVVRTRDDDVIERVRAAAGDGFEVRPVRWNRAGAAACPPTVLPAR
jgi:homoserine kinase